MATRTFCFCSAESFSLRVEAKICCMLKKANSLYADDLLYDFIISEKKAALLMIPL